MTLDLLDCCCYYLHLLHSLGLLELVDYDFERQVIYFVIECFDNNYHRHVQVLYCQAMEQLYVVLCMYHRRHNHMLIKRFSVIESRKGRKHTSTMMFGIIGTKLKLTSRTFLKQQMNFVANR